MFADGFEHGHHVEVLFLAFDFRAAGHDRAAINENGRTVHAGHRHHAAGHILVTATNRDEAVHAFAADDRLDRIGDDLAGNERVFHPFGAHGDAVGDGDGVENHPFTARGVRALGGLDGELVDVDIARSHFAPGGSDADLRLGEILLFESDSVEHRAAGRAVWAIKHETGKWACRVVHRARSIQPIRGARQEQENGFTSSAESGG